ncbi:MAG: sigma-70 family RNA polymerase sigma factor [Sedimentisphaerales bacterium]|nr:sigma-70 family RNA polymerase sigma factor [Sedimentisphaerales bacterium]
MAISEAILLKRFASTGDAEAFAEIVKLHAPLVYGVCLRILKDSDKASDAVQDTFVQLVRDVSHIRGSLPIWLHRVATHKAIDLIRKDSLRKQSEAEFAANSQKIQSAGEYVTWHDISVYIDKELDNLDEQMREVLILRFFEGLTTTEISEKCKISQPTVSRRLESGVGLLRHKLKSRGIVVPAVVLAAMLTENVVKAAPSLVMKELGKIAIAGGHAAAAATGVKIGSSLTAGALKSKIIAIAIVATITTGSIVFYKYFTQPKKPTNIQQTEIHEETGLVRIAYGDSSFLDDLSQRISDLVTGGQVGLIARIYNISDLAKTDEDVNSIIAQIKKNIEPKSWYDNNKKAGGTIIAYTSRQAKNLTIRQSQEAHKKIADLLKSMSPTSELD